MQEYRVVILNEDETRAIYRTIVPAWSNMEARDKGIREYWASHSQRYTLDEMRFRTHAYIKRWF